METVDCPGAGAVKQGAAAPLSPGAGSADLVLKEKEEL